MAYSSYASSSYAAASATANSSQRYTNTYAASSGNSYHQGASSSAASSHLKLANAVRSERPAATAAAMVQHNPSHQPHIPLKVSDNTYKQQQQQQRCGSAHYNTQHQQQAATAAAPPAPSTPRRQTVSGGASTPIRREEEQQQRYYSAPTPAPSSSSSSGSSSSFMTQAKRDQDSQQQRSSRPSSSSGTTAATSRPSTSGRTSVGKANLPTTRSLLPQTSLSHKVLLILDMDETLLHASVQPPASYDINFTVQMDTQKVPVYVSFRPHMVDFLRTVARWFEVAVFTASISKYANQVLDHIDPHGRLIHHRLYREHCTEVDGTYVKDLSLVGRGMDRQVIVDNSPVAYSFQPENAIPIVSWFDDKKDCALPELLPMLERLSRCRSVYDIVEDHKQAITHRR